MSLDGPSPQPGISKKFAIQTKRNDWCKKQVDEKEAFKDVIFTDEVTFQLECHRLKCFRKKKTPTKLKYRHKHPPNVHMWAGISKEGAAQIVIFSRIMDATKHGDMQLPLCHSSVRSIRIITDSSRIMTQSIQAGTFRTSLQRTASIGGRVLLSGTQPN